MKTTCQISPRGSKSLPRIRMLEQVRARSFRAPSLLKQHIPCYGVVFGVVNVLSTPNHRREEIAPEIVTSMFEGGVSYITKSGVRRGEQPVADKSIPIFNNQVFGRSHS